ncbi:hypothetical protein JTE90_019773 [Oedothorax gibbosus]|uniref:Glutamate-gated chloride channel n=1 Tax=Oedothorax gibbosus TaxID=931172 RepID=A0AAV6UMY9_9ARAC|nr:hypothetical protein JTE90_019773 [Oedothorax gibbosus]
MSKQCVEATKGLLFRSQKYQTMKWIFFTLTLAAIGCLVASRNENELIQKYLTKLANSGYNTHVKPTSIKGPGEPIDVECSMYILDIHKVDDVHMDFKAEFYFRQSWNDSRLAYSDDDIREVVLNNDKHIWTPDIFFVEEREGIRHSIITPNTFIRISKTGTVLFSTRVTITFSCPMDFTKYPHDTQKCLFSAESYGYGRSDIQLSWKNISHPVQRNMDIELLPYQIISVKQGVSHISMSSGEYSRLNVELTFHRKVGFFMIRLYIPFIFLTILTWLTFWIPAKLVMPRLSILLVVMYIMIQFGLEINANAPRTSYNKGSDVWIAMCVSLAFGSFLEFIAVHIIGRNKDKLQKRFGKNDPEARAVLENDAKPSPVSNEPSSNTVSLIASRLKRDVLLSGRIDRVSSILFPAFFIGFNFIYWLVYCSGH